MTIFVWKRLAIFHTDKLCKNPNGLCKITRLHGISGSAMRRYRINMNSTLPTNLQELSLLIWKFPFFMIE